MKKITLKARNAVLFYLKWGWPLFLLDIVLARWAGEPITSWRSNLNGAAFVWLLCVPILPLTLLLDRELRERVMGWLCGLREGDERERAVTGEAARTTLLLSLALQTILLVMSLVSVHLAWDPFAPKGEHHGVLEVGMAFAPSRHMDPFGTPVEKSKYLGVGMPEPQPKEIDIAGGFLLAPSTFPVLVLLILIQLAAFKVFAVRRYEGINC